MWSGVARCSARMRSKKRVIAPGWNPARVMKIVPSSSASVSYSRLKCSFIATLAACVATRMPGSRVATAAAIPAIPASRSGSCEAFCMRA